MTLKIARGIARGALWAGLSLTLAAAAAQAAPKGNSGPTQAQIDCKNRAVNDYYDQLKECDKALADLPADNAQCQGDARDDLTRTQAGCMAAAARDGVVGPQAVDGGVISPGTATVPTGRVPGFRPGGAAPQLQRR